MKPKKQLIIELGIIFLLSLTPILWLRHGNIILGHDSGFRLDPIQYLQKVFYSWDPSVNYGFNWSIFKGFLVTQAPETIFTSITNSVYYGQLFTLIFWFFMIGLSMYIFINSFFPERKYLIFRLFSSTFYMYNFFLLQGWFIAERAKFSLFIALPLGLLILYKTLKKEYPLFKGSILFGLLFFFFNAGGSPTFYGAVLVTYGITILYFVLEMYRKKYKNAAFYFSVPLFFAISFLLANAYWIFPQIALILSSFSSTLAQSGGTEGILSWERVVNRSASSLNLFRLQGIPDWYDNKNHPYSDPYLTNPFLIFLSFVPILIIITGLVSTVKEQIENKRFPIIMLVLIIFVIGLLFTAGSHPPFGFLYTFFIKFIPGFVIFRSALYKFGVITWFSTIFLTGYFLNEIIQRYKFSEKIRVAAGLGATIFILAYHYPFFTTNFFAWSPPFSTKVAVPQYVQSMSKYINTSVGTSSRVLLLPGLDSTFKTDSYSWGFWSFDILPVLATNRTFIANTVNSSDLISDIYESINQKNEEMFLSLTNTVGVDKVLWRDDVLYSDKETKSNNLAYIRENLEGFKSIRKEKTIGKWTLYSIQSLGKVNLVDVAQHISILSEDMGIHDFIKLHATSTDSYATISVSQQVPLSKQIKVSVDSIIVKANCIYCPPNEFNKLQDSLMLPDVRFLPDSKFYFLSEWRKKKTKKSVANIPRERLPVDLIFTHRRIAEIEKLIEKQNGEDYIAFIDATITKYKEDLDDALKTAYSLPEEQKNALLIRTLAYLQSQEKVVEGFNRDNKDINKSVDTLLHYINIHIEKLNNTVWMTKDTDRIRYLVSIKDPAIYEISLLQEQSLMADKVLVDGEAVHGKSLYFKKGVHKIELQFFTNANHINNIAQNQVNSLLIGQGKKREYKINNLKQNYIYELRFSYRLEDGFAPNVRIVQDGTTPPTYENIQKNGIHLDNKGKWTDYSFYFLPSINGKNATVEFANCCPNGEESVFSLRNLKVINALTHSIYLIKKTGAMPLQKPSLNYERIDPTKYIVKVKNATGAFFLLFNQQFENNWDAYVDGKEKLGNHLKINDSVNSWYVDKKGTYQIVIQDDFQKYSILGMITSIGTVCMYILYFIFTKIKQWKK